MRTLYASYELLANIIYTFGDKDSCPSDSRLIDMTSDQP